MALLFQLRQTLSGFAEAWHLWPRKEAKKDAEKAWGQKVTSEAIESKVFAAMQWQVPMLEEREPKYRPLLASWLRGERWEDERPAPPKPAPMPDWQRAQLDQVMEQSRKTQEVKRLIAEGMTREDAFKKVWP